MSNLFGRVWKLTVETLETSDLDLSFRVSRALSRPGTAQITVYNYNENHRAQLRNYRRREGTPPNDRVVYARVRLEAGYPDGATSVLFQGNARRIHHTREQPDWVTHIEAIDGEFGLRARAARAFAPGTSLADIARHVAEAMGAGAGNVAQQLASTSMQMPGGAVVHGRAAPQLTRLLRAAGFEWSIQDGVLQVLPRGGALGRTAVVLDTDHGLVEAPEVGLNRVVTCKALLQPDLTPGAQVRLASSVVAGYYRVESCDSAGDTRGGDWTAALEMRRIRADGSIVGVNPP